MEPIAGPGSQGGPGANPTEQVFGAVKPSSSVFQPALVAEVASTFSFPLILMLLVILFLIVQGRLDRRDPKLAQAGRNSPEVIASFEMEEEL